MSTKEQIFRDPWALLNVPRTADDNEIRKAYRALAKKYHPDANPNDAAAASRFAEIGAAYEQIKNAEERAKALAAMPGASPGGGYSGFSEHFSAFDDPSVAEPAPTMVSDKHIKLQISFHEMFVGKQAEVSIDVEEPCGTCGGSGAAPGHKPRACPYCNGTGGHVAGRLRTKCGECKGRGFTVAVPCSQCDGGLVHRRRPFTLDIGAGIPDGTQLRVRDVVAGALGGQITVTINVEESRLFSRINNGADLRIDVPVTFAEACLGTQAKIPTPDRSLLLKVEPGTPNGRVLRIAGHGLPLYGRSGERGDLYARVFVAVPERLNNQQKRLIKELGHYDEDVRASLFRRA